MRVEAPAAPIQISAGERARLDAQAKAAAEETARIRAICGSREGKANPERAAELALETKLSAAEAVAS